MSMLLGSVITAALAVKYEAKIASQIPRTVILAKLLDAQIGDGKNVSWDVRFGDVRPSGYVLPEGSDVTMFNSDTKIPATLNFGTIVEGFALTDKARAMAYASPSPQGLINLLESEAEEAIERLTAAFGYELWFGDTSTSDHMTGILGSPTPALWSSSYGLMDTTGVYAGISRTAYPQWAGTVSLNTASPGTHRDLTLDLMRDHRKAQTVKGRHKPDAWLTSPFNFEEYAKLFGAQRTLLQDVYVRGQKIELDGGNQGLLFDGVPVIEDYDCPEGIMVALNTSSMKLRYLPDAPDLMPERAKGERELEGTEEEQGISGKLSGIKAYLKVLSTAGLYERFAFKLWPCLQIRHPAWNGVLGDLRTSSD
jgi:hypothetical protein